MRNLQHGGELLGRVQHVAKQQATGVQEEGEQDDSESQALYPLSITNPNNPSSWVELSSYPPSLPLTKPSSSFRSLMDSSATKAAFAILSWYVVK